MKGNQQPCNKNINYYYNLIEPLWYIFVAIIVFHIVILSLKFSPLPQLLTIYSLAIFILSAILIKDKFFSENNINITTFELFTQEVNALDRAYLCLILSLVFSILFSVHWNFINAKVNTLSVLFYFLTIVTYFLCLYFWVVNATKNNTKHNNSLLSLITFFIKWGWVLIYYFCFIIAKSFIAQQLDIPHENIYTNATTLGIALLIFLGIIPLPMVILVFLSAIFNRNINREFLPGKKITIKAPSAPFIIYGITLALGSCFVINYNVEKIAMSVIQWGVNNDTREDFHCNNRYFKIKEISGVKIVGVARYLTIKENDYRMILPQDLKEDIHFAYRLLCMKNAPYFKYYPILPKDNN